MDSVVADQTRAVLMGKLPAIILTAFTLFAMSTAVAAPVIYDQLWANNVETAICTHHPQEALCTTTTSPTSPTTTTTLLATTTSQASTTTDPPSAPSDIAGMGCSNTNQIIDGYDSQSSQDRIVNLGRGGRTVTAWATDPRSFNDYDKNGPYNAAWFHLCELASNGLTSQNIDTVLAELWDRDPNLIVYMSPMNFYTTEDCRKTGGNQIPNEGAVLADQYAAAYADVLRGPDIGPLTPAMTTSDRCHLNTTGQVFAGDQLKEFFDE